jgi:hypothetical protein
MRPRAARRYRPLKVQGVMCVTQRENSWLQPNSGQGRKRHGTRGQVRNLKGLV